MSRDARDLTPLGRNLAIVLACAACYFVFIPRFMHYLAPLTGDEPFYVMTALSIAHDRDLDETNNYQQRDYESFYPPDPLPLDWQGWPAFPRDLPPHPAHATRPGLYSKHGLGVALLILPAYLAGKREGVILFLNVVGALVALNIYLLARRQATDWRWPAAVTAALALSNPLMSYSYLIFPEIVAALAIVYAYRRGREERSNLVQWLLVGASLALLPWLHARFIPAALGLGLGLLPALSRERAWRRRLACVVPPLLSALGLASYYVYIYGRPLPDSADHAGFNDLPGTVNGFFGLLLDEQWGLLVYAPVYLLVLVTLSRFCGGRRADAVAIALAVAPYLALVAWYRVWWGEWGPPARYLAPVVPLAAAPLSYWLARTRPAVAVPAFAVAATVGWTIMAGFLRLPQLMYNQPDGHSALFTDWALLVDRQWPKIIPSYQFYALSPVSARVVWAVALLVCALLPLAWGRGKELASPRHAPLEAANPR